MEVNYGTYTPELYPVANLGTPTAFLCQWLRVGDVLTVSGRVDVMPTAPGLCTLDLSLPVGTTFDDRSALAGVAAAVSLAGEVSAVHANVADHRARMEWVTLYAGTTNCMFFTFTYRLTESIPPPDPPTTLPGPGGP